MGGDVPRDFFCLDWNSGFSFLIISGITGTLGGIALTQFGVVVEKGRASEARGFIETVREAQESRFAKRGKYATTADELGVASSSLRYFDAGPIEASNDRPPRWAIRLTRDYHGTGSSWRYGEYRIIYDSLAARVDCEGKKKKACQDDLLR